MSFNSLDGAAYSQNCA